MTFIEALGLFLAAMLGGGLNTVAGGGSFISFPALVFSGVPAVLASATNTVALWPGSVAGVGAYRRELAAQRRELALLSGVSVVGGVLGALLLLVTSDSAFEALLPYLLLLSTLLFTFGGRLTGWLRARFGSGPSRGGLLGVLLLQLTIAVYGGFFGGGIGIMMLAALALMGQDDIHAMNALKNALATVINGVAVVTFVAAGAVVWMPALLMVVGAVLGGYGSGALARRLDPKLVRRFVIAVGFGMTAYFFARAYLG